jgi:hypothetical protein
MREINRVSRSAWISFKEFKESKGMNNDEAINELLKNYKPAKSPVKGKDAE